MVLPEITFDPRDGPDELEAKAQILDRHAAVADTVIESLDEDIEALRELSTPDATVLRAGERRDVPAESLVPGDVVVLEQGDAVPADARLIEAASLETNEAPLTGESGNVDKHVEPVDPDAPLAERSSMVYMNTAVVRGHGRAVVVATGMDTQVGDIAEQLSEAEDRDTPFQEEVDELADEEQAEGAGSAQQLAGNISEALITTASGLVVAIPSLIAYFYFKAKYGKIASQVGKIVVEAT